MDPTRLAPDGPVFKRVVQDTAGDIDIAGLELLRLIKKVASLYDIVNDERLRATDLSGPRFRLLMRLWAEEIQGNLDGTRPTYLSHWQHVSKNTISSLLRGLEEQGLIERALDAADRRVFRIRLTAAGRQLVVDTAPRHLAHLNAMAAGLTPEERGKLAELLQKLYVSMAAHTAMSDTEICESDAEPGTAAAFPFVK